MTLIGCALAACTLILTFFPAISAASAFRWKVATLAPKQVGWSVQMQTLVLPYVEKATNDDLRLKVFWGGVMGNDQEYLSKMHIGQLQGAGVTAMGAHIACPEMVVLGLPFLFNNYDEVDYIREVMFPTFDYYFQENGYKLWLWFDQDFDQAYSSKFPMNKVEDFKNSRFQSWYGPLEVAILRTFGADPIPMPPTEAPSAYRTGAIDANFGPAIFMVGSQMYTSVKYMNDLKIRYAPAIVMTTEQAWKDLPAQYEANLIAGRPELVAAFNKGVREDNTRCIEGMIKYGVEKVSMTPENAKDIRDRALTVYDSLAGKLYPPELLQEVQRHLSAFRRGQTLAKPAPVLARTYKPAEKVAATAKPELPPVVEAAKPVVEAAKPVVEAAKPMMEAAKPVVEAAKPMMEAAKPMMETGKPMMEAGKPMMEEAKPMMEAAKPVVAAAPAMEEEAEAAVDETAKVEAGDLEAMAKAYQESLAAQAQAEKDQKAAAKVAEVKPPEKRLSSWEKRKRLVWAVQEKLQPMGYYNFKIDGIVGPITLQGILDYQKDNGLVQTGAIDEALLESLGVKQP